MPFQGVTNPVRRSALLVLLLTRGLPAQVSPSFEVASIKPSPPRGETVFMGMRADGARMDISYMTARDLVSMAYHIGGSRLIGGTGWAATEYYDIRATLPAGAGRDQVSAMLETLLQDRFQLKVHRETRDTPVYDLVVAPKGPRLTPAPADEKQGMRAGPGGAEWHKATAASLGRYVAGLAGREVVDKTGLEAFYNTTLKWTGDDSGPSIFTAIEEQWGLRLIPGRAPLEYLIVDKIEKPSEN